jgi:hypothetical protein
VKHNSEKKYISLLVLFSFIFTVSCSSFRPVSTSPPQFSNDIEVGDIIRVTKTTGEKIKFKVAVVSDSLIYGERQIFKQGGKIVRWGNELQIPFDEIESIEKKEFSGGKTSALVLGIIVAVAVAFALLVSNMKINPNFRNSSK